MNYKDFGYKSYSDYLERDRHWNIIKQKRINKICDRRFCSNRSTLSHHLHYETLGDEGKGDYVDICYDCNDLAHFDDNGNFILVTHDGKYLKARWREINSLSWNILHFRPSMFFNWITRSYTIQRRPAWN